MDVWVVSFIEDVSVATRVFSNKEKAWNYLENYYKRYYIGAEDETDYKELKKSYECCCKDNGNYFMNEYIVVCKVIVDKE